MLKTMVVLYASLEILQLLITLHQMTTLLKVRVVQYILKEMMLPFKIPICVTTLPESWVVQLPYMEMKGNSLIITYPLMMHSVVVQFIFQVMIVNFQAIKYPTTTLIWLVQLPLKGLIHYLPIIILHLMKRTTQVEQYSYKVKTLISLITTFHLTTLQIMVVEYSVWVKAYI